MGILIGFCLVAIVLAAVAYLRAGKGKNYKGFIIAGFVLYALVLVTSLVTANILQIVGCVISLIILAVVFVICKKKA